MSDRRKNNWRTSGLMALMKHIPKDPPIIIAEPFKGVMELLNAQRPILVIAPCEADYMDLRRALHLLKALARAEDIRRIHSEDDIRGYPLDKLVFLLDGWDHPNSNMRGPRGPVAIIAMHESRGGKVFCLRDDIIKRLHEAAAIKAS